MYLIGDIGNTEIKICIFTTGFTMIKKITLKTNLISDIYLFKKLNFLNNKKYNCKKILFCSVVPSAFKKINLFLRKIIKSKSKELKDFNLEKIIKIKVNKQQIGSDRLANAISVMDNKSNYIILDFGTATTFDVVVKNQYLGGVIAPGVKLSLNTLVSKASLIPSINLSKIRNVIGKNTKTAVKSGFYWGYAGLIDNIIKLIMKQTGIKFKIVFTGGLAHLFKNSINKKVIVDKDLTINGIIKVSKKFK